MSITTTLVITAIIGVILLFLAFRSAGKRAQAVTAALEGLQDFSPVDTFVSMFGPLSISVDSNRAKVVLVPKAGAPVILSSKDILGVEVIRDGTSVQKTNRGSQVAGAAVGGVLLGPVGILLGGLTGSKRTEEKVKNLSLRIFTSNVANPVFNIVFYESPGADPNDTLVKDAASQLGAWDGRLRAIMAA